MSKSKGNPAFYSWLDNLMEGYQVIGFNWRYLYINKAAEVHNRRPKEELLGNKYTDMWPGIENTEIFPYIKRCMEERIPCRIEQELAFPDGIAGWFDLGIQPVPEGILILSCDIKEHKYTEKKLNDALAEALRESEEFFSKVFVAAPFALSIARVSDGKLTEVNDVWCSLMGFRREEALGHDVEELKIIAIEQRNELRKEFLKKGSLKLVENEISTKSGEKKSILTSAEIISLKGEQFSVNLVIDITDRKQAEEALRQSEATIRNKLKAILEPEGDIDTLELADIIDVEVLKSMMEDFYLLTGMPGAVLDISGKVLVAIGWQDICTKFHRCHPGTLKNCTESDTILSNGVSTGIFKAYRCKNNMWDMVTPIMIGDRHIGNVFIGQFFYEDEIPDVELFRKQGQKYGYDETKYLAAVDKVPRFSREIVNAGMQFYAKLAGIISTLSYSTIKQSRMLVERNQAEEEITKLNEELELRVKQRTEQLETANKELETFTYSVSHDLKAPLRGIDGYSKLLLDLYGKQLTDEAQFFLTTIRSSTLQMNQLIEDLLEYSRLERSQMRNEKVQIKNLIVSIVSLYKDEINTGRYSLKIEVPEIELVADSKGLTIALRNLLENALKFTRSKSSPVIEISLKEENTSWIISVSDNGIGFDMKYHQKIFEIFQRLHRAEDFPGTGIGLAMVSKAMQRMQGRAWAESTQGVGSVFYLEIPKSL